MKVIRKLAKPRRSCRSSPSFFLRHHLVLHALLIWDHHPQHDDGGGVGRGAAAVRAFSPIHRPPPPPPPSTPRRCGLGAPRRGGMHAPQPMTSSSTPRACLPARHFRHRAARGPPRWSFLHVDSRDDSAAASDETRNDEEHDPPRHHHSHPQRRRTFGIALAGRAASLCWCGSMGLLGGASPPVARARGLVQFPLSGPLLNSYHLMRAGSSLLQERDIYSTNPLFLTNRDDALSPLGQEQVVNACQLLASSPHNRLLPTVVRYSLAARCVDTANVVARELRLGRDRVIAEYTYLDPRAVGRWDMLSLERIEPALVAFDHDHAGPDGASGRPPPNEDGTPHETLSDAAVRLRQLLSVLETLYSGDTILLIFPDGTGPALLSCLMAGIPLNRVHELEFQSGELRVNVTPESTKELWATRRDSAAYQDMVARGRVTLRELQAAAPDTIVSKRDQQIEAERLDLEREFQEKQRAQQVRNDEQERARAERNAAVETERRRQRASTPGPRPDPVLVGLAGALAVGGAAVAVIPSASSSVPTPEGESRESRDEPEAVRPAGLYATPVEVRRRVNGDRSNALATEKEGQVPEEEVAVSKPVPPPPPPALSPLEAAQLAMDEYMNRDDGADDWLQSLADIIDEPDDDAGSGSST